MKMFVSITLVCLCILPLIPGGMLAEVVTTRLGGVARLNCSTTTGGSVEWKRIFFKESSVTLGYIYVHPWLHKPYDTGGRHNVSLDPLTGACDLVITNVIESDAGKYVCTQTLGRKERPFELVVLLVKDPTCRTSPSLTNVLVENDCNIEPDNIEFNCSIAYRGNVPPAMQLQMSSIGVLDDVTASSWVQSNTNYHLVQWVSKARRQMRGGRFQCEVRMVDIPPSCSSGKVSVMFFFKSKRTEKIPSNKDKKVQRILTCAANTSEQCSYSWLKPHQDSSNNNLFEVFGSVIDLSEQHVDLHPILCRAKCILRDISCVAEPLIIEFSSDKEIITPAALEIIIPAIVVPVLLVVVVIIVLALLRKYKILERCRKTRETIKSAPSEVVPLNPGPKDTAEDYFSGPPQKRLQTSESSSGVINPQTPESFVNCPVSIQQPGRTQQIPGISVGVTSEIIGEVTTTQHEDTASNIAPKLQHSIYKRGLRQNWREILKDNRHRLVTELDVSEKFLAELLVRRVITEKHKATIQSKATNYEKVDLLIDILRRRPDKCCEEFCDILRFHNPDLVDLSTGYSSKLGRLKKSQKGFRDNLKTRLEFYRMRLVMELDFSLTFIAALLAEGVINAEDEAIIQSEETPHGKIDSLIDILQRKDDRCYEVFCDILWNFNSDLADLLAGYSSSPNERIRNNMKNFYLEIRARLDPRGHILSTLFETEVLTDGELRRLNSVADRGSQIDQLYVILSDKPANTQAFVHFQKALQKDYSWMADMLVKKG